MKPDEHLQLQNAILTIADPNGNWEYGWRSLCELAGIDPLNFPAPFRERDIKTQFRDQKRGPEAKGE